MLDILELHDYFTLVEVLSPLACSILVVVLKLPQRISKSLGYLSPDALLVAFHLCFVFAAIFVDFIFGNVGKTTAFYQYAEYKNVIHRSDFANMLIFYVLISSVISGVICGLANQKVIRWFFIGIIVGLPSVLYIYKGQDDAKSI